MSKTTTVVTALAAGVALGLAGGSWLMSLPAGAQAPASPTSFSAVPNAIGAQDISGPYDVVEGWPKPLSALPGHDKWTYGGARNVFGESPNRVFLLGGGELPKMNRPPTRLYPAVGPNVQYPVPGLPWRNANTASPPGNGGSRQDAAQGMAVWRGSAPNQRELGVDSRWHHSKPRWPAASSRNCRPNSKSSSRSRTRPSIAWPAASSRSCSTARN